MDSMGANSVAARRPQADARLYFQKGYDNKGQFSSYWHQIDEVYSLKTDGVLEIGKGTGFVHDYLNKYGITVISIDIDPLLRPDVSGSVLNLPFKNDSFEAILCCEVLEHLPFIYFKSSLEEIYRVAKKFVILSLPQNVKRVYRVFLEFPKFKSIQKMLSLPIRKYDPYPFDDLHYWEIDVQGYPYRKIVKEIERSGFSITKSYRVFEKVYHRFFILQKC